MSHNGRIAKLRFVVPDDMSDDEAHDAAELIAADLVSGYGLSAFDGTEVVDES